MTHFVSHTTIKSILNIGCVCTGTYTWRFWYVCPVCYRLFACVHTCTHTHSQIRLTLRPDASCHAFVSFSICLCFQGPSSNANTIYKIMKTGYSSAHTTWLYLTEGWHCERYFRKPPLLSGLRCKRTVYRMYYYSLSPSHMQFLTSMYMMYSDINDVWEI